MNSTFDTRRVAPALLVGLALTGCLTGTGNLAEDEAASTSASSSATPIEFKELRDPDVWSRAFAQCMTDNGFRATMNDDGSVLVDHLNEQLEAMAQAADECDTKLVEAGISPDPSQPLSEELVRLNYDRMIAIQECLVENELPVGDVPSWEAYVEMRGQGEAEGRWNPFDEVRKIGDVELLNDAFHTCIPEN